MSETEYTKVVDGVEITDSYDNTQELLKSFPVENPTTIDTDLGKKIENRLLTGFENWNRGIPAWKAWGTILYTPDSIYDVHGARMTLAEYQASMAAMLQRVDIKMGAFHNIVINDNWTAIRYDISTNGQPGSVMEFVNFKDYGGDLGTRVVEGWGGTKDPSYKYMVMFLNDEEKAAEQKAIQDLIDYAVPDTDDLEDKYKVLYPTAPKSANAAAMKAAILKNFDAWNQGQEAWEANLDEFLADGAVVEAPVLRKLTADEFKKEAAAFRAKTTREKKYFDSILISDDWAAWHFRFVDTDAASGSRDTGDGMQFAHFNADGKVDQLVIS